MRSDRVLIVHSNRLTIPLQTEDPILTHLPIPLVRASSAVVVEEAVQPSAIDAYDARIHDPQTPPISRRNREPVRGDRVLGELRVEVPPRVRKRDLSVRVGLIVRCLRLNLASEDVLRVNELVFVLDVVFHGCADEPDRAGRAFVEETAAGVDGDLAELGVFDVVVGDL